jgi:hypothetical protein
MFFSQCMISNVCRIRRSCTVTPASHKLDSMHYTITVYSHIPRHITALSHKLQSMNQNITVHSHIPRHITAFSHNLDSMHHNITVYSYVTVQDCVRYTYFPIRKVKETCPSLYSVFVYRVRRLSSFVRAVLSCPLLSLIRKLQVLSTAHPSWWRSHVGLAIKIGPLSPPLVRHWQMPSMPKVHILLQCFGAPSYYVGVAIFCTLINY